MKTTNKSTVELIDSMGTDLTVVNAARVSFDKESDWDGGQVYKLEERDAKLINYLAKHNHWSPFAHTSIQLRVNAPLFVARQLVKHQVGGVWNEVSRRYVDEEPTFYFPDKWRKRADNVKQGSSDEEVSTIKWELSPVDDSYHETDIHKDVPASVNGLVGLYKVLLRSGVAPEQARMILPQNMMTTWYWTGSLKFFHRVWQERSDPHAQLETQEVAKQINTICSELFPTSWKALLNAR